MRTRYFYYMSLSVILVYSFRLMLLGNENLNSYSIYTLASLPDENETAINLESITPLHTSEPERPALLLDEPELMLMRKYAQKNKSNFLSMLLYEIMIMVKSSNSIFLLMSCFLLLYYFQSFMGGMGGMEGMGEMRRMGIMGIMGRMGEVSEENEMPDWEDYFNKDVR